MLNIVQSGGVNWVFSTISRNISQHAGQPNIITPLPIPDADMYLAVCPEYALSLTPEQARRAACIVHHFEEADATRTVEARRHIFDAVHTVVCQSTPVLKQLADAGIRAQVIPYGVDMERFTIGMKTDHRRGPVIGVCGRNHATGRKSPLRIYEIARAMAGQHATFVFCGHEWEGLAEKINEFGTAELWLGSGKYDTYPAFYNSLDALLCASDIEGGPYPPLEALACGVPVVSTPVGHMPDLVAPGTSNVLLFDFGDVQTAAAAIVYLYRKPPDRAMLRASVADRSWESVGRKWAALLKGMA